MAEHCYVCSKELAMDEINSVTEYLNTLLPETLQAIKKEVLALAKHQNKSDSHHICKKCLKRVMP